MVMTTPSTAATMPKPGRASPTRTSAAGTAHRLLVLLLEIEVEDLGEMVIFDGAGEQHLQRVAEEGDARDGCPKKLGYFLKMSLFSGSSMCASEPDEPVLARRLKHLVEHLQQLGVGLLVVRIRLEQPEQLGEACA